MISVFIESGILGIMLGLIASVYRGVLAYEEPFSAWWRFGGRFEDRWFFKPVWGCAMCFAGQLALWGYFIVHLSFQKPLFLALSIGVTVKIPTLQGYSIIGHLFAVSAAIFAAIVFTSKIDRMK